MKDIDITSIEGFKIGHAQDNEKATGCTVIISQDGAIAGVDVRGGGPATRETDLLDPKNMVEQIHAVVLSGGSAFGLEASSGVMKYLSENNIGFEMKGITIPIVCQASLFDCSVADPKAYPDREMGYQACIDAQNNLPKQGNVGAGTGASVGKFLGFDKAMKSGLGIAAIQVGPLKVGAVVAVNACGDIYYPNSDQRLSGIYDYTTNQEINSEEAILDQANDVMKEAMANTTIGCIITNANLTKAQMNKVASVAHNGYAHCIRPVHTSSDGDTIFALGSKKISADVDVVGIMATKTMEKAIVNAAINAKAAYGLISYNELNK